MPAPVLSLVADRADPRAARALHSRVWEPAARALLEDLALPAEASVLRIGWSGQDGTTHDGTYDLVHARFQLSMLGRPAEQIAAYKALVAPGGILLIEEPDTRT